MTGLRREEVATLSGVGVTWYTMLESGAEMNVSPATLEAICRALHLSDDELAYAQALAFGAAPVAPGDTPDPLARTAIDSLAIPAYVCTTQWTALAWMWTPELRALHGDGFAAFAARVVAMVRTGTKTPSSPRRGTPTTSRRRSEPDARRSTRRPPDASPTKR